jgi:acetyltransferase-like isoleucine patch superfamily enzyme
MGNATDFQLSSRWSGLKNHFGNAAIGLFGWMPSPLGARLRQGIYQVCFARLGRYSNIRSGVQFIGTSKISVGRGFSCHPGVRLRASSPKSYIQIGDHVSLDLGVDVKAHGHGGINLGTRVYIGPYTCLSGSKLVIGENTLIASHCGIYSNNHVFDDPNRPIRNQGNTYKGVSIGDDCWLGTGVKVVDGVTIGRGSVIGAGAVVTKDLPPYSIAVGVPAKVIGQRKPDESPQLTELEGRSLSHPEATLTLT